MLDVEGTQLSAEDRELLNHPACGGVILFSRNFQNPEQVRQLTAEIHALREPHLLIAVDHEGGRVQRFREGFSSLPAAAWYGENYREKSQLGLSLAEQGGWLMAAELRSVGVDFSFAPVLDLDMGVSEVIGDRAFSSSPEVVADLARAWMRGVHRAGMAAVGKHFPGHGAVRADSHHALPVDQRRLEDIEIDDLRPFERMIHAGLEAIMPAHVVYPKVDRNLAGFSPFWLQQILRKRLGFQGVIFSDDLSMAAAEEAGSFGERALAARAAGCDMVLVCNNRQAAAQVLEQLREDVDPVSHLRLVRMHGRGDMTSESLHLDPEWKKAVNRLVQAEDGASLDLNFN
ncbi:Periplasmic beta-glucosidase or glycosidase-like protein [endosymbiont of Ridgeia piscesae]|jgi:beta-N-acetylhexosaminidase|uniref:Beta-hexosaminidase n=2 Tax=endosymbiont of Ridgeia piscesae TaxID=54398 RepID=A0A0T5YZX0_9GAMM|nr:Periplasmic beta-glucosidase or glycosidase-like protein [endosymbiont of Ridgeia piscesae]KRT59536.1 beta-N-acetylhexosaminidase [endosymbiont of Ridgeia piscesae]